MDRLRSNVPFACTIGASVVLACAIASASAGEQSQTAASPASKPPPATAKPQTYSAEQVKAGESRFIAECGFCHGRDAAGGENGPDLIRSALVAADDHGDKIGPLIRQGRPDKGMPGLSLSDSDVAAIVAFIHDTKAKIAALGGGRRSVDVEDLQTGDLEAGRQFFNGAGGCAKCHSATTGAFAKIGSRYKGLALLHRLLYPGSGSDAGPAPSRPAATLTLRDGQTVTGKLVRQSEFTITIVDSDGWTRTWPMDQVRVTIDNPLQAHVELLSKYTDKQMHDVFAYLQSLK
ncbi:MAG TPA: c-type cytochrome [Vicinamibacterales bacterium]|nr:c-type cytochrome [Vicinamibacterales bacterium]